MAARKRGFQLWVRLSKFQEINAGSLAVNRPQSGRFSVNSYGSLSSNSSGHRLDYRHISLLVKPTGRRVYLVDTLALVCFFFLNFWLMFLLLFVATRNGATHFKVMVIVRCGPLRINKIVFMLLSLWNSGCNHVYLLHQMLFLPIFKR